MPTGRRSAVWRGVIAACVLASCAPSIAAASEAAGDRAAEQGAYDVAVQEYEAALEEAPDDVELLLKAAEAKTLLATERDPPQKIELFEEAAAHAERATQLAPDDPEAHFERARALGRLAEHRGIFESLEIAGAVHDELQRTLELEPEHASALHALALWHYYAPWVAGGRSSEIGPLFERAIELEPNNVSHRRAYGEILLDLGEREAAREQLQAAVEIEDDSFLGQQEIQRARELLREHFGGEPAGEASAGARV